MVGDYYWVHSVIQETFIEHLLLPGTVLDTALTELTFSCDLQETRCRFDFILETIKETALLSLITYTQHLDGFVSVKFIVPTFCNCKPLKWFTVSSISWLERCSVSVRHFLNFAGTWLFSFVYTYFLDCIAEWSVIDIKYVL